MKEWKNKFIEELKKQIGKRYALGGGQMKKWKGYDNLDNKGNWVGFDCCGGIMHALRQATEINLTMRNVPGMMQAPWLYPVTEMALQEGDLIFVDIPGKDENGDIMRDKNGYPVYGKFNHVMTYLGWDRYQIIGMFFDFNTGEIELEIRQRDYSDEFERITGYNPT